MRAVKQDEWITATPGPAPERGAAMAMRPATPPQLRVHDARELAGDAPEAILRLDGMDYRLRITRSGKLILTK